MPKGSDDKKNDPQMNMYLMQQMNMYRDLLAQMSYQNSLLERSMNSQQDQNQDSQEKRSKEESRD